MKDIEFMIGCGCSINHDVRSYGFTLPPAWTREPPTRPGFYWARPKRVSGPAHNLPPIKAEPVEVTEWSAEELVAWSTGWDVQSSLDAFEWWAGPIEAPPLPEEGER